MNTENAEAGANMRKLECLCGDSNLIADSVTLKLFGMPFILTGDGPEYDDSEAKYSEGWDYNQDSRCHCASCGAVYDIASDDKADMYLEPVAQEAKP